jgi:hypothetical protein
MTDVEDRLREYRPAGPPRQLRDGVMRAAAASVAHAGVVPPVPGSRVLHGWLAPALGAGVAAVFYLLASGVRTDVASRLAEADRAREAMVADLAAQLGGDEMARENAERLVEADEQAARSDADPLDGSAAQVTNHD